MISNFLNENKTNYACKSLAIIRKNYSLKICFKPSLLFLKNKISITNSLSNRLVIKSDYRRSYKNVNEYYIKTLRSNFLKNNLKFKSYELTSLSKNLLCKALIGRGSIKNFDILLLWKATQINSLFNVKITTKKKRKKYYYSYRVFYINPKKRILFVWKWLSIYLRTLNVKKVKRHLPLIPGFNNFFFSSTDNHIVTKFKYQVYKLQLLRHL